LRDVRSQDIGSLETGFRTAFCQATQADSCAKRWANGRTFLARALADSRVPDIGTISYMFGTIYVETGSKDFAPSTTEVIGSVNRSRDYVRDGFYGRGWIQLTYKDKYQLASRVLGKDLVAHPELALTADNAYEILFRGMTEGWIEVYRTSV